MSNTVKKRDANILRRLFTVLTFAVLIFFALGQTFPFYLELVRSVQPKNYIPKFGSFELWPTGFNFGNYVTAVREADMARGFLNTFIVAGSYVILSAANCLVAGYVLGKKNFRGKNVVFFGLLATMMVPGEVLLAPNYWLMLQFRFEDKLIALILPGMINALGIFLVRQYMVTIPDSIIESVKIDGAKQFTIIRKIILPLALPILGTYCIITFISLWNDYLWPMIIIKTPSRYTLQLKLMEFVPSSFGSPEFNKTLRSAGLMVTLVPVLILYAVFQKQFVQGISISGMK